MDVMAYLIAAAIFLVYMGQLAAIFMKASEPYRSMRRLTRGHSVDRHTPRPGAAQLERFATFATAIQNLERNRNREQDKVDWQHEGF